MNDLFLALIWISILTIGLATCVMLRRAGVRSTYVRDLLHIGAGVWIFGWPLWSGVAVPLSITLAAVLLTASIGKIERARGLIDAISDRDEAWTGILVYTASFALFTGLGLAFDPLPAAMALLALSLGDGIGGLVGRKFGRLRFRVPGAKSKTIEGSLAVAGGALAGAYLAAFALARPLELSTALAVAITAAVAEALSRRSTDNLIVPSATWLVATWMVSS